MTKTCINCIHKDVCYKYRLNYVCVREGTCSDFYQMAENRLDFKEGYKQAILDGKTNFSRPQEWIPIKTRPLTEEEKEEYPDSTFMYDCKLPEDGEEVLITTSCGYVVLDTFYRDDGCYFECYCDQDDVIAWQSKPKPYKREADSE